MSSIVIKDKTVYSIVKQNGIIITAIMVKMLSLNVIHNKTSYDETLFYAVYSIIYAVSLNLFINTYFVQ